MKVKSVVTLLIAGSGIALSAGHVLATPSSGLTATTLAKSLFEPLDVEGHVSSADACQSSQGKIEDWERCAGWKARANTGGPSDVWVVDNKLVPGGTTGWHSHPGPSLILVVAGTVTNYTSDDPSCTGHAYSAGQGFVDPGGTHVHILRNEDSLPAETIAVQLLPRDAVRRIDAPDPGNCHF